METRKSKNRGRIVGTIVETNFTYDVGIVNKFDDRVKGAFTKNEFKNPMFVVKVEDKDDNGNVISTTNVKVDGFDVFKDFYTKEGERKENSAFKVLEKMISSNNQGVGTRVIFSSASLGENVYFNDDLELVQGINVDRGNFIETSPEKTEKAKDIALFNISGVISKIETNDDESLSVNLYFSKKADGTISELKGLVVDADVAGDFLTYFSEGDRVEMQIQAIDVVHGKIEEDTSKGGTFGQKKQMSNGYVALEYKITYAEPIDGDDDEYIDEEVLGQGLELREAELKAKKQKKQEKGSSSNKATESKGGLGQKKEFLDAIPDDDEDNPFA